MKCRFCESNHLSNIIDLGKSPVANAYVKKESLNKGETWWPLKVVFCEECFLVQTLDNSNSEEYFTEDYAYFSSYSKSWVSHAKKIVESSFDRFCVDKNDLVIEVAANDGYLLQFVKEKKIPCIGIEPTLSTASAAEKKGIEIIKEFFNIKLAKSIKIKRGTAKLIFANNVLAHVPNIKNFVSGFYELMDSNSVAIFEFANVLELVKQFQFDTIYHEHFSYLSLLAVENIFKECGLEVFDVEIIETHGGSLRIYAQLLNSSNFNKTKNLFNLREIEQKNKLHDISGYKDLGLGCKRIKLNTLKFLISKKETGKLIVAYGAAAKGNTFLNYLGVKSDLIEYVVDKSPGKLGKYLPGSNIPIVDENEIIKYKPDYILLLPWNLKNELVTQLSYVKDWGCKLVVAVPELEVI